MRHVQANLNFILDTLAIIQASIPSNKEVFMDDINAKDAALMRLQDIGEQLAQIRDKFPDFYVEHSSDEWHKFIGLRNVISHGYRDVDFDIIWDIITNKLLGFAADIQKLAGTYK